MHSEDPGLRLNHRGKRVAGILGKLALLAGALLAIVGGDDITRATWGVALLALGLALLLIGKEGDAMKKLIVLCALLSMLGAPNVNAAPAAAPICGRVVRRIVPIDDRGFYRYDVMVGGKVLRWSAPARLALGARICV
jgi:hypothetical protein